MINILSCKIFKPELEKILPHLKTEFGENINISYLPSALHDDNDKLASALQCGIKNLNCSADQNNQNKTILLYGSMCHPDLCKIAAAHNSICFNPPKFPNCIDMMLSKEKKESLENGSNVHFMTLGWIDFWKDIFSGKNEKGWDPVTARMNLGVNDKIIILDTNCTEITCEDIFEIFDYIQLPVEVSQLELDYFTKNVAALIRVCNG